MKVTLKGRYKVGIERHGECVHETDWFDNLITDRGMDLFGEGFDNYCWVGSGTATPTCADMGLQFPYGFYAEEYQEANFFDQWEDGVNYSADQSTYRFGIGEIHGMVSEVGIGPQSYDLFSRSLLPNALYLDGDIDRLYVIYELRICIPQESQFFDLVINGTTHSCESYPVGTDGAYWSVEIGGQIWMLGYGQSAAQQPFAAYQDQVDDNHVEMGNGDRQDYVPGSFQLLREGISLGPGVTDTFTRLRLGCGWRSVYGIQHTNGGVYDVLVDPPIVIEDHQRLLITAGVSWAACGDGCAGDPNGTAPPGDGGDTGGGDTGGGDTGGGDTGGGDTGGGDTGGGDTGGGSPDDVLEVTVEFLPSKRFSLNMITTDTNDEYEYIETWEYADKTLVPSSEVTSAVNGKTSQTGVSAEYVGTTTDGYEIKYKVDTSTAPFEAEVNTGMEVYWNPDQPLMYYFREYLSKA